MEIQKLFDDHIRAITPQTESALQVARAAGETFDGIVFHAGSPKNYHADDQPVEFRPTPHFARFAPVAGPDHLLLFKPGQKLQLVQVVPEDFWYEPPTEPDHPYAKVLETRRVSTAAEARAALGTVAGCAYVGSDPSVAQELGIDAKAVEPRTLVAALDWNRALKTPYEVECIREAVRIASRGHDVVRRGVDSRLSERELHAAYLEATGLLEPQTPYTNIIAWDDRSAILHYQTKRTQAPKLGTCLLIDAGATFHGYTSDITRTYLRNGGHAVFSQILDRMETLQLGLVDQVRPGESFVTLHEAAHRGVAQILCDLGILKLDAEAAFERDLTRPFLPHGLGHHLGIQVHDVGGRQVSPQGEHRDPPPKHRFLRTTRPLAEGHVVTIEPGLYFIPMLLDPQRTSKDASAFDWKLIDELLPSGGIRIEDDVLVTAAGHENLSRPFVPGHRDAAVKTPSV